MEESGSNDAVNLKRAATLLGVHYMTVYRYVRQGRLAAERIGTEWRVPIQSIQEFRMAAVSGRDDDEVAQTWAIRLESCLLMADEVTGWNVIERALGSGRPPGYCYTEVIARALASIGDRFEHGTATAAEQYIATAVAMRLIVRLGARFRKRGRSRGTFVFGAPSGELHGVPIAIVAELIRLGGFDVLELGVNVPPAAFASATSVARLIAIGIGVSRDDLAESVAETVDAVRAANPDVPIVVGGVASAGLAGMDGVTAFVNDGQEALTIVESLAMRRGIRRVV